MRGGLVGRIIGVLDLAVPPGTAPEDAKYLRFHLVASALGLGLSLPLAILALATSSNTAAFVLALSAGVNLSAIVLLLAHRPRASKVAFNYGFLAFFCLAAWLFGSGYRVHWWLFATAVYAALVYNRREQALMLGSTACSLVGFLVFEYLAVVSGGLRPVIDLGFTPVLAWATNASLAMFLLMAATVMHRYARMAENHLAEERARSERLLTNILPEEIAARLKAKPGVIADSFDQAAVLFADVVGFTVMSSGLPPQQVVQMLNEIFHEFDDIAERHRLEKIKTIGDAYMVAGGVPVQDPEQLAAVAQMGLDMLEVMKGRRGPGGESLHLRIGIHAGPVVAGVIGKKKFSYDLWGDTVNLASRMESHGEPGRVQVSESVRQGLEGRFVFECRGPVSVKGKGKMTTWWLVGAAQPAARRGQVTPEASVA